MLIRAFPTPPEMRGLWKSSARWPHWLFPTASFGKGGEILKSVIFTFTDPAN
jgi:hypothetical protein